jgi:hypothetical protein
VKKHRSPGELAAEIAASLMWGPKPRAEIAEAVGFTIKRTGSLNKYLDQFRASGCVYIEGFTKQGREIFNWQPTPFELPDAVRPEKPKRVTGGQRSNAVTVTVDCVAMSINAAASMLGVHRKVIAYRREKKIPIETGNPRKCPPRQA